MTRIQRTLGQLRVACAASFFLFAAAWSHALDPNKPITDYTHHTWSVDQGLPHSTVRGLVQTADGYLWIGTHEGLARFDGREFSVFNEANAPVLRGSGVATLLATRDRALWIGLRDGGLVRYAAGVFSAVSPAGELPRGSIGAIAEEANGVIWVGSSGGGLARLDKGNARLYTSKDGLPSQTVSAIEVTANGSIWVGTYGGLVRVAGDRLIANPTGTALDTTAIVALASLGGGDIAVGTNGGGLYLLQGDKITHLTTKDGLISDAVTRLLRDRDGALWLGTPEGLQRRVGDSFVTYASPQGLSNNVVRELLQDTDGSLWVGSDRGLDRFRDGAISTWGKHHGLEELFHRAVLEDSKGNVWVGTTEGVFRRNAQGVKRFSRAEGLLSAGVLSIEEGRDGTLWVGTNAGGIHRLRGERFENVGAAAGLPNVPVRAIKVSRDGSLWLGTNVGVIRLVAGAIATSFNITHGLRSEQVLALYEDKDADMWVGTRDGVAVISSGSVVQRPDLSGLRGSVFAIHQDARNQMWFAGGDGLSLLQAGKLRKFGEKEGLPPRAYFTVVDDTLGNFWLCSNEGLVKLAISELEALAAAKLARVRAIAFGRADGMASKQCNGGVQPAGWRGRDGRLFFPTAEGLAVVDPAHTSQVVRKPPTALLESVVVDGEPMATASGIVMAANRRRISFRYNGISFIDPDKIIYRHRLVGFDPDWVKTGNVGRATYTNLEPGDYRFEFSASLGDGQWSKPESAVQLRRDAPFFRALWFQLSMAGALLGTFLVGYRARAIRLHRRRVELEDQVKMRTEELAMEKSKLQALSEEKSRLLVQVHEQSEAYKRLATEDSLTRLANRRELDRQLGRELQRAIRSKQPLVVVLADLDHFKQVNDRFSHAVGDEVLRRVGRLFRENCRANDLAARYGGEEFVLVLPGANMEEAGVLCERLRAAIEDHPWDEVVTGLRVTMSFGLAARGDTTDANRLLDMADGKLYKAKQNGRNRVEA